MRLLWASLGLKRRFFAFFLLGAIIPLLILSILFQYNMNRLVQDRSQELLETGLLFSREIILDELDKMELVKGHLIINWPQMLKRKSLQQTIGTPAFEQWLRQHLLGTNTDAALIVNTEGQTVRFIKIRPYASDQISRIPMASRRLLIRQAQLQKPARDLVLVSAKPEQGDAFLLLTSAIALPSAQSPQEVVLILLKDLRHLSRHSDFLSMPKNLHLRIFGVDGDKVFSVMEDTFSPSSLPERPLPRLSQLQTYGLSKHEVQGISYTSLAWPLRDFEKHILGYQLISISTQSLNTLIHQDTAYIVLYLAVAIGLITVMGGWLNRTLISPINALAEISETVASGDLTVRIQEEVGYREMDRTLRNFNQMLDQLQENENLRLTFISTLTHDLRTPLIAQKRAIDFLKSYHGNQLDSESISLLNGLHQSHEHLLDMVNDLLEVYQHEAGRVKLHLAPADLGKLVQECLDSLMPLAVSKQIQMINQVPSGFSICVDASQFRRIIINLTANSLENIQESGRIEISASRQADGVEIQLRDNGPGIPDALLPHLFKRYPGNLIARQQKIGFGLGLYICNLLTTLHGGQIKVESSSGLGTTFFIYLPDKDK